LNSKQRVHAALSGQPVDRNPVTVLYNFLYYRDHFQELTGRSQWQVSQWLHGGPDAYVDTLRDLIALAPFECIQPEVAPTREDRDAAEFFEEAGRHYLRNRRTGEVELLDTISGIAQDYAANETQKVFDRDDAREQIVVTPAAEIIAAGRMDYVRATVGALGDDHFILSGGVIGPIYSSGWYLGQTNALAMLRSDPEFMDYICARITEQNIEHIRAMAAQGGDGIYIDDATATSDMVSVKHYERFSLPHMKAMVDEIHRLGHKAIIIYFGGIGDRLEQLAAVGADGLSMETSMKGYVNDIDEIAGAIGQRVTLFGNIDPLGVLEQATDEELEREMRRQAAAGRQGRGFVMCTGSPITPDTPIARVQRFLELGRQIQ
jgi:hypothetical protein